MERVSADGHRIHFSCCGFELEGHASGPGLEGTGKAQGEAFSWKAQAAPGLPARPNLDDHQEIPGITGGALDSNESEPGPIYLQGDHGAVSYRNIVLTPAVE